MFLTSYFTSVIGSSLCFGAAGRAEPVTGAERARESGAAVHGAAEADLRPEQPERTLELPSLEALRGRAEAVVESARDAAQASEVEEPRAASGGRDRSS